MGFPPCLCCLAVRHLAEHEANHYHYPESVTLQDAGGDICTISFPPDLRLSQWQFFSAGKQSETVVIETDRASRQGTAQLQPFWMACCIGRFGFRDLR